MIKDEWNVKAIREASANVQELAAAIRFNVEIDKNIAKKYLTEKAARIKREAEFMLSMCEDDES